MALLKAYNMDTVVASLLTGDEHHISHTLGLRNKLKMNKNRMKTRKLPKCILFLLFQILYSLIAFLIKTEYD